MATIIQNLACLEVKLQGNSGRAYFDEDILHGKTIRNLWALFSAEDKALYSPFSVPSRPLRV